MSKQFISPPEVGPTMGLYHKAIRAGNTIYASGQVPWDADGNVVGPGDIEVQRRRVLDNLRTVVEAGGGTLAGVVSTTTYMTNALYRPQVNALRQEYGLTGATNTSLVVAGLVDPRFTLEVSGVAVVDTPTQRIVPDDVHDVSGRYAHAIRAGNTIYVAGQVALDPQGNLVGPGDIDAQATQAYENLRRVLAAAGATFDSIVKVTTYITNVLYRPALTRVRGRIGFPDKPSTLIVIPSLALPEFLIEIEAIAVVDTPLEIFNPPTVHDVTGRYAHAARAGDTIYVAGQVAVDRESNLVGRGDVAVQAGQVDRNLALVLEAAGASLDDVVRTTTYLTNMADRPAVNEVRKQFGLTRTANSTLAITSLAGAEYLLEVDAIAVVGA